MAREGVVFVHNRPAGRIREDEEGYHFAYDPAYASAPDAVPVSLAMPLRAERYSSRTMPAFFDGLIPEGWLLDIAQSTWKLNPRDRMGLLLACCRDCIGSVSVQPVEADA